MSAGWIRVTKQVPCAVCQHPDWCTVHPDIGSCCMRVSNEHPMHNGGWLHKFGAKIVIPFKPKPDPPSINATAIMNRWVDSTKTEWVEKFAALLGVAFDALAALGVAWAAPHRAWAFPMRDAWGNPCGIRLRAPDGHKWCVTGSRQGIFLPDTKPQSTAYLCEGPTDAAAALTIGLFAIGRPSNVGGNGQVMQVLRRLGVRRAVIVADNDEPGIMGAQKLASEINVPSCVFTPPCKDLREFVRLGGTPAMIESVTRNVQWNIYAQQHGGISTEKKISCQA